MTVTTATDIPWTLNHPDTWYLLVCGCGWTTDRYEKRVGDTLTTQLLRDRDTTRKLSSRKNTGSG